VGFTNSNYYQEKFTKTTLSNEIVKEVEFEECEFKDCSFVDCEFLKCKFINCSFDGCMISAVIPTDSRFVEVSFANSKVIGLDWTKAKHIREIGFENCQINYSNFRQLKLPKIR